MNSSFFRGKRVLVTGAAGLIGSAFVEPLRTAGASVRVTQHIRPIPFRDLEILVGDLRDPGFCRKACAGVDVVIHGAGVSGGSRQVSVAPIPMFTDSLLMNTLVLEAARTSGVGRFLFISNSSVYPKGDQLLQESMGTLDAPENETGYVKRIGETQALLYQRHADLKVAIIRTGNAYGPWDNFDLDSSHVVPALIAKAADPSRPMLLWGSGQAQRDFIHTADIARAGLFLLEHHAVAEPINVATGRRVSMIQLAEIILEASGRKGDPIVCSGEAPPAPAVKALDLTRMHQLGFSPHLSLEEGLAQTVAWFHAQRSS